MATGISEYSNKVTHWLMKSVFEPTQRFTGCPPVCVETNLPAFDSVKQATEFLEKHAPRASIIEKMECAACGKWHIRGSSLNPAGDSSGTGRSSKDVQNRFKALRENL